MTDAAHTSGLPNPPTDVERLLATLRWLVAVIFIHWIIAFGRQIAAAARRGANTADDSFLARHFGTADRTQILPRVTQALHRAATLEASLLARRPIEQGFSVETCRAVGMEMIAICRDLGMIRRKPASAIAKTTHRRAFHHMRRTPSARRPGPRPAIPSRATRRASTGPPALSLRGRETAEAIPIRALARSNTRVYPWNLSRCAPASFFVFASSRLCGES